MDQTTQHLPFKPGRIFAIKPEKVKLSAADRVLELLDTQYFQSVGELFDRDEGAVFKREQQVRNTLKLLIRGGKVKYRNRLPLNFSKRKTAPNDSNQAQFEYRKTGVLDV